jgi:hypothetical protein
MKDINKVLCERMYEFVKEHINEVTEKQDIFGHPQTFESLGFKDAKDMLVQIKNDADIAYWALTELLYWALPRDYMHEIFIQEETDTFTVFKLQYGDKERYLICKYELHKPIEIKEVRKVTKFVEVNAWEDIV